MDVLVERPSMKRHPHPRRDGHPRGGQADGHADNVEDYYELLDPGVDWIPITALLDGRRYRGPEGVRRWVEELRRDWQVFEIRWTEVRDLGEGRVLAFGFWDCLGRRAGVRMSFDQAAWLIELRGGKLARLQTFVDRTEAIAAAGLRA
jgi:ketosteroid isomerase-like protein